MRGEGACGDFLRPKGTVMSDDVQERLRRLEQGQRFWKRVALAAVATLVLVLVAFTSLSIVLYTALMAEKDRFAQQVQELRKTAEDGLQTGKDLLRGLKLDRQKVRERLRQFLTPETPKGPTAEGR
jgi:hypothetical protein